MPPSRAIKLSHLDVLIGVQRLKERMNEPSLTDFYLMQAAMETRMSFSDWKGTMEQFKLKFKTDRDEHIDLTPDEATELMMQKWQMFAGDKKLKGDKSRLDPKESPPIQDEPVRPKKPPQYLLERMQNLKKGKTDGR